MVVRDRWRVSKEKVGCVILKVREKVGFRKEVEEGVDRRHDDDSEINESDCIVSRNR
jgi:hypothetical protein